MLKHIYIKNFTIIDELDLELFNGMMVLTGETGAGKSIVIDAIELALGRRASVDMVHEGAERADICVTFDIARNMEAIQFLKEYDLDNEEICLLRRVIHKDGRSKSSVNGVPVTQSVLRELSELLVNIHGQHEFQTLLKREHQRGLLDDFAHHDDLLKDIKKIYVDWRETKKEIERLDQGGQDIQAKRDFLHYQVQELDELNLCEDEITEINQEYKQLSNADLLLNNCQMAAVAMEGDTYDKISTINALNRAYQAMVAISSLHPSLQNMVESIENVVVQVKEISQELRYFLDKIESNPEQLVFLETRLNTINNLAKKHRVDPTDLSMIHQQLRDELNQLENSDERLRVLQSRIEQFESDYLKYAHKLSISRQKAAKKLSQFITKNIQQLGMPNGQFEVILESTEDQNPHSCGLEKVVFLISTNPGQSMKPLTQVASGGELSRMSLAIQVVAAQNDKTPTLIFDEIDVGIGGAIAEIVGKLLRDLGEMTQVFCITHLPQVASKGHHHFQVEKRADQKNTTVSINHLDSKRRVQEIARMLGGLNITAQTLAHAKEMVKER